MAPTIHQRVNGWLWSWATGPGWCRDGSEMAKLRSDGMRVLKVQLQDNGPIPRDQADEWRAAGMKVWGAVGHVDGDDPTELARWLKGERNRLALAGLDCNFESDVLNHDAASGGQWSVKFANEGPPTHAYSADAPEHLLWDSGGLAGDQLGRVRADVQRLSADPAKLTGNTVWNDPPTRMVEWTSGASPPWPRRW